MRVLIIGAGVVGLSLAEQLSLEGHDIALLEKQEILLNEVKEHLDVLAICGDATCPFDLAKARIEEADMVIAVTDDDARNILVCQIATKYGVERKIARVRNRTLIGENSPLTAEELGIDKAISPETVTVETIKNAMQVPGAAEVADFARGDVLLCGFYTDPTSPVIGLRLEQLKDKTSTAPFLIVAIARGKKLVIPKGNEVLQSNDHIFVLMEKNYTSEFLKLIGKDYHGKAKKIIVLSASPLAQYLARTLESSVEKIVIIEKNMELAQRASSELSAHIVHGEVTDLEVIRTVGMENADYFIAVSDDEESNILCSLVAKKYGARQVITLQRTNRYESLLHYLDIDMIVNPKRLTVGETLKYIRKGRIHAVTKLQESEAEVIELEATANAPIVGFPLKSVAMPQGGIIGAILRDRKMVIPTGEDFVYPGETVIVFALPKAIDKIERLFGSG